MLAGIKRSSIKVPMTPSIISDRRQSSQSVSQSVSSPELGVPGEGGDYPGETLDTDGVGAGEELGVVIPPIVVTEAGAARQEGFIEVLVVDGDSLHQGAAQIHFYLKFYKVR